MIKMNFWLLLPLKSSLSEPVNYSHWLLWMTSFCKVALYSNADDTLQRSGLQVPRRQITKTVPGRTLQALPWNFPTDTKSINTQSLPPECGGGPQSRTTPWPSRTDTVLLNLVLKFSRSDVETKQKWISERIIKVTRYPKKCLSFGKLFGNL